MALQKLNFGPGNLTTPSAISLSDWEKINTYVQKITDLPPRVASHVHLFAPSFPKLEASAQQWRTVTFPGLIDLSRSIHTYATAEVGTAYAALSAFAESPENLPSFQQALNRLIAEAEQRAKRSAALGADAAQFALLAGDVVRELKMQKGPQARSMRPFNPIEEIAQIGQALSELSGVVQQLEQSPLKTIQYMQGSWLAIRDDLKAFLDIYADEFHEGSAILTGYGIESALSQWSQVAAEAKRFAEKVW